MSARLTRRQAVRPVRLEPPVRLPSALSPLFEDLSRSSAASAGSEWPGGLSLQGQILHRSIGAPLAFLAGAYSTVRRPCGRCSPVGRADGVSSLRPRASPAIRAVSQPLQRCLSARNPARVCPIASKALGRPIGGHASPHRAKIQNRKALHEQALEEIEPI